MENVRKNRLALTAACMLGMGTNGIVVGSHPPPLDRPTPPPCCADGLCYPNPVTWGHYQTRWRRWPTDYLEPLPEGVRPPARVEGDVPGYVTPPPEEEDRRAPPPTAPRGEPETDVTPPAGAPPAGPAPGPGAAPGPGGPREPAGRQTPPDTTPAPRPFGPGLPPGQQPPTSLPFGSPDIDEDSPASTLPFDNAPPPPTTLPFGPPMGSADPPPAPPFATAGRDEAPSERSATGPASTPSAPPKAPQPDRDPPPALPIAMLR